MALFRPRENRILAELKKGMVPLGMLIYTGDPSMIEILALAGFDFYVLDMEHSRINVETMEHCMRAADAVGITSVIRVPENNPTHIRYSIEAGAQGVIVPHVKNREDAEKARDAIRYPPEGKCGICPAIRAANYSTPAWEEYLEHSSKETMLIPILEDLEAIDKAEEIFTELKPGTDAVWFGRGDLAQAIRKDGEKVPWDDPYIAKAFGEVLTLSKRTGIPTMATPWPEPTCECAQETMGKGVRIMLYATEQLLFYNLCLDIVKNLKR
jgi:2-keto-3-deoxy-L-rhamnonate aldolase RhmA